MSRIDMITLSLDEIDIPDGRRAIDADSVKRLAASIKEIGLRHPISVRSVDGRFRLVAGRHRLEAVRHNNGDRIAAVVVKDDDIDARLWEIAENLHRADLTVAERAEQIAEWTRLAKEKRERERERERVSAQVGPKPQGGRPESGDRLASRELGITRQEVQRAEKIANIAPEAKEAARAASLDDNQAALLRVASQPSAEAQLAAIRREQEAAEVARLNRTHNRVIALTEAQQFAEWLLARSDLSEVPQLISWLEGCKGADVIAALRREAA